jgi:hypothetical protein
MQCVYCAIWTNPLNLLQVTLTIKPSAVYVRLQNILGRLVIRVLQGTLNFHSINVGCRESIQME